MAYIIERLAEPSTWRGIIMIITSLGIGVAPDLIAPIVAAGTGLAGIIGVVAKGK